MLKRLAEIIVRLPWEYISINTIFVEVDLVRYGEIKGELKDYVIAFDEKVADIGKAIRLNYQGKNIIITYNKKAKTKQEEIYVAFRTSGDDRIQNTAGSEAKDDSGGQVV